MDYSQEKGLEETQTIQQLQKQNRGTPNFDFGCQGKTLEK